MKFNFIPPGQYYSTVMNPEKQNDISYGGWGADWANASTVLPELFTKEGGFNLNQNWDDPAYAAFKKKSDVAKVETDRAKQAKMWQELSQYVMDQYWIVRVSFGKSQQSWGSQVGGVYYWEPQGSFGYGQLYVKN
jgi:peptide/nickel transport system substrate-binding protein